MILGGAVSVLTGFIDCFVVEQSVGPETGRFHAKYLGNILWDHGYVTSLKRLGVQMWQELNPKSHSFTWPITLTYCHRMSWDNYNADTE